MNGCALVVGIEQYELALAPALMGPALNAIRFALWLRKQGMDADKIHVCITKSGLWSGTDETAYAAKAAELQAEGVQVREATDLATIQGLWKTVMPAGGPTLYVYWSGHGIVLRQRHQAMLCSKLANGQPEYFYLSEFEEALRSAPYLAIRDSRIIIDTCATPVGIKDLRAHEWRPPTEPVQLDQGYGDQTVLAATRKGKAARAEQGGSLFSRVLLKLLEEQSWPADLPVFFGVLADAIRAEGGELPRIQIQSGNYSHDVRLDANPLAVEIQALLNKCGVAPSDYRPLFNKTVGGQSNALGERDAWYLGDMLEELCELQRDATEPELLIEFLARVERGFGAKAEAVAEFLAGSALRKAMWEKANQKLAREGTEYCLVVTLEDGNPATGFPVRMNANLLNPALQETVAKLGDVRKITTMAELKAAVCQKVQQMRGYITGWDTVTVQIFANPVLMHAPLHNLPFGAEEDDSTLGHYYPFIVRSWGRALGSSPGLDIWGEKSTALLTRAIADLQVCGECDANSEAWDRISALDGMLSIRSVLPSEGGEERPIAQKILRGAINRGLPLIAWRVKEPAHSWDEFETDMKKLFVDSGGIDQAPLGLRKLRRSNDWARETVLLWDDPARLPCLPATEPTQG